MTALLSSPWPSGRPSANVFIDVLSPVERVQINKATLLPLLKADDGAAPLTVDTIVKVVAFLSHQHDLHRTLINQHRAMVQEGNVVLGLFGWETDIPNLPEFDYILPIRQYLMGEYSMFSPRADTQRTRLSTFLLQEVRGPDGFNQDYTLNGQAIAQLGRAGVATDIQFEASEWCFVNGDGVQEGDGYPWVELQVPGMILRV